MNQFIAKKQKGLTKQAPKRKRVLSFDQIEDSTVVAQIKAHIQEIKEEMRDETLVSLSNWCETKGVDLVAMTRLLKEAELPIVKIGDFQGVYEIHLKRVLNQEAERQLEQQAQNRACAKILAHRQHGEKGNKGFPTKQL